MSENKKKILEMLAEGKISADDAYRLISAVESGERGQGDTGHANTGHEDSGYQGAGVKTKPKYFRVTVMPREDCEDPKRVDHVNVRIPMSLVRAGIKLTALIPPEVMDKANSALREKGIDFDVRNIKPGDVEDLIEAMGDMQIDVNSAKGEKIKVFVE
jgi:hypothetical protein